MQTPSIQDEKWLFLQIAEGDETAFRKLFNIYVPLLGPTIFQIVKTGEIVDDIIQETMLRVWINRDSLPEIQNPRSWILRIAYHLSFSHLRKKATHHKAVNRLSGTDPVPPTSEVEEALAFRTMVALVGEAVQQLAPQQKKIYKLSREAGLKPHEIAEQLQLSEQTVKNTLVRALKAIREYIEKKGHLLLLLMWWFRV